MKKLLFIGEEKNGLGTVNKFLNNDYEQNILWERKVLCIWIRMKMKKNWNTTITT